MATPDENLGRVADTLKVLAKVLDDPVHEQLRRTAEALERLATAAEQEMMYRLGRDRQQEQGHTLALQRRLGELLRAVEEADVAVRADYPRAVQCPEGAIDIHYQGLLHEATDARAAVERFRRRYPEITTLA